MPATVAEQGIPLHRLLEFAPRLAAPSALAASTPRALPHPVAKGFNKDGPLDPLLKSLFYAALALVMGKMPWEWLTGTGLG